MVTAGAVLGSVFRRQLGGLSLIFVCHLPEYTSDFSVRRYPGVECAESGEIDQFVVSQHGGRPPANIKQTKALLVL
jgi:hypothetical protein